MYLINVLSQSTLMVLFCLFIIQCERDKTNIDNTKSSTTPIQPQGHRKHLILSTGASSPISNSKNTGIVDQIVIEAFARVGKEVVIDRLPAERGITSANEGLTDGEMNRVGGLSRKYPNLVQVMEKNLDFNFVAFSKLKNISINNWQSLKPYRLGIIIGWKIYEKNTLGFPHLIKVKNPWILFKLLDLDRVDIILYRDMEGLEIINKHKYKGIHIIRPPLAVKQMFIYLNKKHKILVPKLTDALKEMKQDGTYKRIISKHLKTRSSIR